MKKDLIKVVGGIILGLVLLAALAACGGSSGGTTLAPSVPTASAVPSPTAAPAPTTSSTGPSNSDPLAQGKLIFEKMAGGVGCAYCHGLDGKGKISVSTPNIRGVPEAQVRAALAGGVEMMSFIKLTEEEITALVAYLEYLNRP